jgi:alanyl-tRNA synthetase
MQRLSSAEIRKRYLQFFQENGHTVVPSASIIPSNNPTLLFTNAGMVPFVDTFLGLEQRPYTRAVSAQKCLRVSGKHNDLDEVGPSPRHHTFFEMLGNFSFGDYFKAEAIPLAWKLLTEVLELPVERLWFTIFQGNDQVPADTEAEQLWIKAGASPDRILRFGEKDNFWVMGDTGPCGPCTEITMYIGDDLSKMSPEGVNSDDPDYVEIWNNVFMQFDRATMQPLPRPSVDTGMGLERIAMVMQGVKSTYETDLFVPIINRVIELAGTDEAHYRENFAAYRAVADHTRSITFLIAEGILPGNVGRSYVLRRILRRAAYQARLVGLTKPFLAQTADVVIEQMGESYPELRARRDFILETITEEEERFSRTISSGLVKLDALVQRLTEKGETVLSGEDAFRLKDTDGFPLDLTQKILAERGLSVDEAGFEAALEEQRERGRAAAQFKRGAEAATWAEMELPATEFTGYTNTVDNGKVLAIVANGDAVSSAQAGQQVQIVLDRTPFYAESGGQVGDTGVLVADGVRVSVNDTLRPVPGLNVLYAEITEGTLSVGDTVQAIVDAERRNDIMRNHTATHLLHRALHDVLGEHATQAGSLVAPERFRFDFNHPRAVTPEQLSEIEHRINAWVRADTLVEWEITAYQDALDRGAMALFGEKYGDSVRMVTVGCADDHAHGVMCSRELCGGIHVNRTGEIGYVKIVSEGGVSSGVRRIEALAGRGAEAWIDTQASTTRELSARLGVPANQLIERIEALQAELKQRQRDLDALRSQAARASLGDLLNQKQSQNGMEFIVAQVQASDANALREMGDWLRDKLGSGVIVLATVLNEKPQILAVVTPDLVKKGYHAGNLVRALAQIVGGGGGGRPDMAQAGGRDVSKLEAALAEVPSLLQAQGSGA